MDFNIVYYFLASVQIAITIKLCWMEMRRESPFFLFWAALLLVYLVPSLADPFTREGAVNPNAIAVRLAGNPALLKAQFFYVCFAALYLGWRSTTAEAVFTGTSNSLILRFQNIRSNGLRAALPFALVLVALICMLASVGFRVSTLLQGSYTSYRLEADTPLKLASYYLGVAAGGSALLYWVRRQRYIAIIILGAFMLIFLAGRTRQVLAAAVLPFALYTAFRARGFFGRAQVVLAGVGLFLLFALLQFLRYTPTLSSGLTLLINGALFDQFFVRIAASQGEAALRFAYYYFFQHSDYSGFGHGLTYVRLIMFWLPASLSGGLKPLDFDETLYSQYYPTDVTAVHGTLHILFPGSAYVNLWWFGVLLAIPLAALAGKLNRWLHSTEPDVAAVALGPASYAAVMLARGSVYNTSMMLVASLIIIWLLFQFAPVYSRRSPHLHSALKA